MKKHYLIWLLFFASFSQLKAQPAASAPTPPARNAANVISVYSDAYSSISGTDFNPNWGQSGFGSTSEITIGTDNVRKYANINYQGWQFAGSINASSMTSLHVDVWTSDCTALDVYPIVPGQPEQYNRITPQASGWTSVDIPLSAYTIPLNNIIQFKFVSTPFGGATVYLDNVYFWTNATLPTLSGFNVPAKKLGDAAFALTAPSSNSNGVFSYTSTNADVATIAGNVVTIVGAGTTTITATQDAAGIYSSGSITATLVVGYNPPTTAAPVPTLPANKVISLFSDSYTNKSVDTWSAVWDVADVSDTVISGNNTKKYANLLYSGIEFTGANSLDATNMQYLHVDIWTPSSSPIKIKLVDFGANNAYDGGGDDKSSIEYVLTPAATLGEWTSYNIPLSAFTGLDTRAHLSQMLFVSANSTVYFDNVFFSTEASLPVALQQLNASIHQDGVQVTWKTANEINNKGFSIERSSNAANWQTIGFVAAQASTTASTNYQFVDTKPTSGMQYYRLKQIDMNGSIHYSSAVSINYTVGNKMNVRVFPNPAIQQLHIQLPAVQTKSVSLQLCDASGKTIVSKTVLSLNGGNTVTLQVQGLAKGIYNLRVKTDDNTYNTAVSIQQ